MELACVGRRMSRLFFNGAFRLLVVVAEPTTEPWETPCDVAFSERVRVAVIVHRLICDRKVNDHLLYSHSLCSCNNVNLLSHKSRANERRHERSRGGSHGHWGHALRTRRLRTRAAHSCLMYCKFDRYKLDQKKGKFKIL